MSEVLFYGREPKVANPSSYYGKSRFVHVMLDKGMHRPKTGIYQLLFDDHYYIGRSIHIRNRVKQHAKEIELLVNKANPKDNAQRKMLQYLQEHPELSILKVKILEECAETDLQEKEAYWLNALGHDDKCLNASLHALKTHRDKAREDFKEGMYEIKCTLSSFEQFLRFKRLLKEIPNLHSYGFAE